MNRRNFLAGAAAAGLGAATLAACGSNSESAPSTASSAPAANVGSIEQRSLVAPDGTALALRTMGSGDLVIIHPSLARGASDFDVVASLIARAGYRVVSLDPRGCAATRNARPDAKFTLDDLAADVRLVVDEFGGGKAHMVGHDFGNRVMRRLAVTAPDVVRSVTLWGAGSGEPSPDAVAILTAVISAKTPPEEHRQAVARGFFAPGNDPKVWYTGWYEAGGVLESAASRATPADTYAAGGTSPMLILQGGQDFIAPPERSAELATKLGERAKRVVIDEAGHAMIPEQPAAVAAETVAFIKQH